MSSAHRYLKPDFWTKAGFLGWRESVEPVLVLRSGANAHDSGLWPRHIDGDRLRPVAALHIAGTVGHFHAHIELRSDIRRQVEDMIAVVLERLGERLPRPGRPSCVVK